MKFYYNNKLVRTSKTHEYKFALMTPGNTCLKCSSTIDGCEQERSRRMCELQRGIDNCNNAIKAIDLGKDFYWAKWSRTDEYKVELDGTRTKADFMAHILELKEKMQNCRELKVVELECRV